MASRDDDDDDDAFGFCGLIWMIETMPMTLTLLMM